MSYFHRQLTTSSGQSESHFNRHRLSNNYQCQQCALIDDDCPNYANPLLEPLSNSAVEGLLATNRVLLGSNQRGSSEGALIL